MSQVTYHMSGDAQESPPPQVLWPLMSWQEPLVGRAGVLLPPHLPHLHLPGLRHGDVQPGGLPALVRHVPPGSTADLGQTRATAGGTGGTVSRYFFWNTAASWLGWTVFALNWQRGPVE